MKFKDFKHLTEMYWPSHIRYGQHVMNCLYYVKRELYEQVKTTEHDIFYTLDEQLIINSLNYMEKEWTQL
jgi:hypothetical protein